MFNPLKKCEPIFSNNETKRQKCHWQTWFKIRRLGGRCKVWLENTESNCLLEFSESRSYQKYLEEFQKGSHKWLANGHIYTTGCTCWRWGQLWPFSNMNWKTTISFLFPWDRSQGSQRQPRRLAPSQVLVPKDVQVGQLDISWARPLFLSLIHISEPTRPY